MATAAATELTDATWSQAVVQCKALTLVDFYTKWCPHCKALRPIIDQLAAEYQGKVSICAIDVEANHVVANAQVIHAIPVVRLFRNGNLALWELVGEAGIQEYRNAIDRLLKSHSI